MIIYTITDEKDVDEFLELYPDSPATKEDLMGFFERFEQYSFDIDNGKVVSAIKNGKLLTISNFSEWIN